ncbi:MAG: DUF134 domain-containing protein [Candidatus Njordarchaeum guaymaensis]
MSRRRRRGWRRKSYPGRPIKPRYLSGLPPFRHFIPSIPSTMQIQPKEPVFLSFDEFEALKLIDLEDLTQESAGNRMGVSRGTIWRLLKSARKKIITALLEGREILIVPQAPVRIESNVVEEEKEPEQ